jgi:hypothetical protein
VTLVGALIHEHSLALLQYAGKGKVNVRLGQQADIETVSVYF